MKVSFYSYKPILQSVSLKQFSSRCIKGNAELVIIALLEGNHRQRQEATKEGGDLGVLERRKCGGERITRSSDTRKMGKSYSYLCECVWEVVESFSGSVAMCTGVVPMMPCCVVWVTSGCGC